MSIILCKNYKCPYNKKIEPVSFSFSQIYTPFEGDKCHGQCSASKYVLGEFDFNEHDIRYEGSACSLDLGGSPRDFNRSICGKMNCIHNEDRFCTRQEILIDSLKTLWVCKCFAFRKIRGHTDWFSLLKPDGTAKGGHVDDKMANNMYKDNLKFKSFGTWHRVGKEDTRKKESHEKNIY